MAFKFPRTTLLLVCLTVMAWASAPTRSWAGLRGQGVFGSDGYMGFRGGFALPMGHHGNVWISSYLDTFYDHFLPLCGFWDQAHFRGMGKVVIQGKSLWFSMEGALVPDVGDGFSSGQITLELSHPTTKVSPVFTISRIGYTDTLNVSKTDKTWTDGGNNIKVGIYSHMKKVAYELSLSQTFYDTAIALTARPAVMSSQMGDAWYIGYPKTSLYAELSRSFYWVERGQGGNFITPSIYFQLTSYAAEWPSEESFGAKLNYVAAGNPVNFHLWTALEFVHPTDGGNSRTFVVLGASFM